jgi:hypothetical protein
MSTVAAVRQPPRGFDLLRIKAVRTLVSWSGFPYAFQAIGLLAFLALMAAGWGRYAPGGVNAKLYAKTNLVTLVVWGVWWPAMIWAAVLLGRAWCAVCPLELVANGSERLGRRLGIRQKPLPRWVTTGSVIMALYALLQLLVAGAHINRIPAYTSLFLLGLLGVAFASALVFKDRAFCRGFCPVGQLLATYGRGGMLAVRAGSSGTCGACTGKDCLMSCNRNRLDARSCPSLLNPPRLNSSRDCLVCGQCIKACLPDNMRLLLRRPFPSEDARETQANWPTTLFVMLVSGFVIWELLAEWPRGEEAFLAAPHWIASRLAPPALAGLYAGGMLRLTRRAASIASTWRRIALPLAVLVAAGHMTKGLAKFTSWVVFLPQALRDPDGTSTVFALTANALHQPPALMSLSAVAAVGAVLVLGAFALAVRESRLADPRAVLDRRLVVPKLALLTVFLAILAGWALA